VVRDFPLPMHRQAFKAAEAARCAADQPLTPVPLPTDTLDAGKFKQFTVPFRAPGPFPAAISAVIRVVADWSNQIAELNETSNTEEFPIRIQ